MEDSSSLMRTEGCGVMMKSSNPLLDISVSRLSKTMVLQQQDASCSPPARALPSAVEGVSMIQKEVSKSATQSVLAMNVS